MNNNTSYQHHFSMVKIYYFSGTGNAANVARWFSEVAISKNIESEVVNIAKVSKEEIKGEDNKMLIGFCSPTHGFNFPPITLKFLIRFPKGKNRVFIMNTRAGMKLWKFYLCGLSGLAQLMAALILVMKGYEVVGMRPIDLPSNWISVHPGLRKKVAASMFVRCERNTKRFAEYILSGKRRYRALYDVIQDLAVTPIAVLYYLIGRFVLAKSLVASHACTMCGLCVKSCPVQAIKEIDKRPYWTFKCESCMKCMNTCPERAIQAAHGLVIGSLYLISTVGMELLYFSTKDKIPQGVVHELFENRGFEFIISAVLTLSFIFLSYRIFHFLMRYRIFERLVILTSLTIYKFWRRYNSRNIVQSPREK